jgi:hypothetical protein
LHDTILEDISVLELCVRRMLCQCDICHDLQIVGQLHDLGQLHDSSLTSIVEDSNLASLMMFSGVISFSVCSASCCPFY